MGASKSKPVVYTEPEVYLNLINFINKGYLKQLCTREMIKYMLVNNIDVIIIKISSDVTCVNGTWYNTVNLSESICFRSQESTIIKKITTLINNIESLPERDYKLYINFGYLYKKFIADITLPKHDTIETLKKILSPDVTVPISVVSHIARWRNNNLFWINLGYFTKVLEPDIIKEILVCNKNYISVSVTNELYEDEKEMWHPKIYKMCCIGSVYANKFYGYALLKYDKKLSCTECMELVRNNYNNFINECHHELREQPCTITIKCCDDHTYEMECDTKKQGLKYLKKIIP